MKIQLKMKSLLSGQHFPKAIKGQVTLMPIVETGQKLNLPVLITSKFVEDSIKNEVAIMLKTFSLLYVYGRLKGKKLSWEIMWIV